jgi:hypothetical protein
MNDHDPSQPIQTYTKQPIADQKASNVAFTATNEAAKSNAVDVAAPNTVALNAASDFKSIAVPYEDTAAKRFLRLSTGAVIDDVPAEFCDDLDAITNDIEYLRTSPEFFQMEYDRGSFSRSFVDWFLRVGVPAYNQPTDDDADLLASTPVDPFTIVASKHVTKRVSARLLKKGKLLVLVHKTEQ